MEKKDKDYKTTASKDENEATTKYDQNFVNLLSQKFDQLTGTDMKKIEEQKVRIEKRIFGMYCP